MARYRHALPQLNGGIFLTDGGLETTLVFHKGIELPCFACFDLFRRPDGAAILKDYYRPYAALARERGLGFILDSATWRANRDWGAKLGYSAIALAEANRRSIDCLVELRGEFETERSPFVINGVIGPRGDGYDPGVQMSAEEAEAYHGEQIATFAATEADMVTAVTLNYVAEAVGVARAAQRAGMPAVISFTVETDGRLPTGQTLKEAVLAVDAETGSAPAYYMINCAHPAHFADALIAEPWMERIRGIRANASRRSHAELDQSTDLDAGDPVELGLEYRLLLRRFPHINVLGGCCGTDHRHVQAICSACLPDRPAQAA